MESQAEVPRTSLPYLFLGSVAALFLEMTLIRWVSTEVRVFAYVQNLALVACFLGFGLGCYHSGKRIRYLMGTICTCVLAVLIASPSPQWRVFMMAMSELLTLAPDTQMWSGLNPNGNWTAYIALATGVVTLLLLLLIGAMFPLGQYIGRALDEAKEPIKAYSVNLSGSLAGGWLLAGLSFLWTKPALWIAICFVMIFTLRQPRRFLITSVVAALVLLGASRFGPTDPNVTVWSPYQKLSLHQVNQSDYELFVNSTGYMTLAHADPAKASSPSSYDSPFRFALARERVLVVGSGGGNDVAAALRNGVSHVDAVEIDPAILSIGKRFHPDHPYDSTAVEVVINDARNFMRTTTRRYDMVIFGLLDSHTVAGHTNMRIDNYVYTEESFREAMRLLKPEGVLVLKFEVHRPWLWMGNRFDSMLTRVAGRPPVAYLAPPIDGLWGASVFLTSNSPTLWERVKNPDLAAFLGQHPPAFDRNTADIPPGTSDDWPFVYHRSKTIPRTYLTVTIILVLIALALFGPKLEVRAGETWHFFFLGAGFLCLETQMVTRAALYFGSTWLVNCFVVSAVLVVLVGANIAVQGSRGLRRNTAFTMLVASLFAVYLVPWAKIPLSAAGTGVLLLAAYGVPLFCAGTIFAGSFRDCKHRSSALGSNLFGATCGGVAQNLSFIFGLNALLLVAGLFYGAAWLFSERESARLQRREKVPEYAAAAGD